MERNRFFNDSEGKMYISLIKYIFLINHNVHIMDEGFLFVNDIKKALQTIILSTPN